MTWTLALEQLRANSVFTRWTAFTMTLLLALLAFVLTVGATRASIRLDLDRAEANDRAYSAWLIADAQVPVSLQRTEHSMEIRDLRVLVDAANADGAEAVAVAYRTIGIQGDPSQPGWERFESVDALAVYGSFPWDDVLAAGRAPARAGEVVLAADVAESLGLSVGSEVAVLANQVYGDEGQSPQSKTVTAVGLTRASTLAPFDVYGTTMLLHWSEATTPNGLALHYVWNPASNGPSGELEARVSWNAEHSALAPLNAWGPYEMSRSPFSLPNSAALWVGAGAALFAAMIIMGFAFGRSQAAARTKWVATARLLGATRGQIASATLIEGGLVAAAALLAGTGLGVGVAAVQLAIARASVPYPAGPALVTFPWWSAAILVSAAAIVSVIVAGVPAYWASRVSPAAALKPVRDATEGDLPSRVPVKSMWWVLASGAFLILIGGRFSWGMSNQLILGGGLAMLAATVALMLERLRRAIPALGRRMSRSRRPGLLSAGGGMIARPRQGVALAMLWALAAALASAKATSQATGRASEYLWTHLQFVRADVSDDISLWWSSIIGGSAIPAALVAFLAMQVVAMAIFAGQRAATGREVAAARAMGLSQRQDQFASWIQLWVPQAVGAVLGSAVGTVLVTAGGIVGWDSQGRTRLIGVAAGALAGLLGTLLIAAYALAIAACVAFLATRRASLSLPVEAAQKVSA